VAANGPYVSIVEAPSESDPRVAVRLGLCKETIDLLRQAAMRTAMSQFFGIVEDGLMEASHLFKGLQRPLCHGENMQADQAVLIYVLTPDYDFVWMGDETSGDTVKVEPPSNRVFVVLARQIEMDEHGVSGTIEHWNWVQRDMHLAEAPIGYSERYKNRVWSR
jgi:hypothetical protein